MKIRFIEPGNRPYKKTLLNHLVYDRYIRTPSQGIITLATILHQKYDDVRCYSESISEIVWDDVLDADIIFFSIFTFQAERGYKLADDIRSKTKARIVFGGLHATLNPEEAMAHADFVMRGEGDETILMVAEAIENGTDIREIPGIVYRDGEKIVFGPKAIPPVQIDTVPDRSLMYRFKEATIYNTIWPQVHASRGCPHNCAYCSLVAAFGRKVRCRSPQSVIEDIRQAIDFFDSKYHRLSRVLWITDDNFFANREWAKSVLNAIIESGIKYHFTIQARYEVGFDDEMLDLLKKAGFFQLAMGIEFLEDEAFQMYQKKSTYSEIMRSVKNIQAHGIQVRGLFIFGADNHTVGIGKKLADFVVRNDIVGVLIQSMYFIPGTPVYETHKDRLIMPHLWSRSNGKVVHKPKQMNPMELQNEIIDASSRIYSFKRFVSAMLFRRGIDRTLFLGECLWQYFVRKDLREDLPFLYQYCDN